MWVGNVNIRFKKLLKKVGKTVYFVIYRVLSCMARNLSLYCLNQLALERSSKKGMHVGVCIRRILFFFVKVVLVNIWDIAKLNGGLQPKCVHIYFEFLQKIRLKLK